MWRSLVGQVSNRVLGTEWTLSSVGGKEGEGVDGTVKDCCKRVRKKVEVTVVESSPRTVKDDLVAPRKEQRETRARDGSRWTRGVTRFHL